MRLLSQVRCVTAFGCAVISSRGDNLHKGQRLLCSSSRPGVEPHEIPTFTHCTIMSLTIVVWCINNSNISKVSCIINMWCKICVIVWYSSPVWGRAPLFPLVHLLPHLLSFLLFPFFHWLYLVSSFVHPFTFYRIVPLRFQAGGRRRRSNLGLFSLFCSLICVISVYLYSLVEIWIVVFCSIWVSLVLFVPSVLWHCWLGHLTRKNPSPIWPIMCLVGR